MSLFDGAQPPAGKPQYTPFSRGGVMKHIPRSGYRPGDSSTAGTGSPMQQPARPPMSMGGGGGNPFGGGGNPFMGSTSPAGFPGMGSPPIPMGAPVREGGIPAMPQMGPIPIPEHMLGGDYPMPGPMAGIPGGAMPGVPGMPAAFPGLGGDLGGQQMMPQMGGGGLPQAPVGTPQYTPFSRGGVMRSIPRSGYQGG